MSSENKPSGDVSRLWRTLEVRRHESGFASVTIGSPAPRDPIAAGGDEAIRRNPFTIFGLTTSSRLSFVDETTEAPACGALK